MATRMLNYILRVAGAINKRAILLTVVERVLKKHSSKSTIYLPKNVVLRPLGVSRNREREKSSHQRDTK